MVRRARAAAAARGAPWARDTVLGRRDHRAAAARGPGGAAPAPAAGA
jgi:hypothetical protein